jgi:hypothetical protein
MLWYTISDTVQNICIFNICGSSTIYFEAYVAVTILHSNVHSPLPLNQTCYLHYFLFSCMCNMRKFCESWKINQSQDFNRFTYFQHPWICSSSPNACLSVCIWPLLEPRRLDEFYAHSVFMSSSITGWCCMNMNILASKQCPSNRLQKTKLRFNYIWLNSVIYEIHLQK